MHRLACRPSNSSRRRPSSHHSLRAWSCENAFSSEPGCKLTRPSKGSSMHDNGRDAVRRVWKGQELCYDIVRRFLSLSMLVLMLGITVWWIRAKCRISTKCTNCTMLWLLYALLLVNLMIVKMNGVYRCSFTGISTLWSILGLVMYVLHLVFLHQTNCWLVHRTEQQDKLGYGRQARNHRHYRDHLPRSK